MAIYILILISLFILGSAVGSFISVVIFRLHNKEKGILLGRSKCVSCKTCLRTSDLVPIFSYLFLRGKCRYCNKGISFMYPLLEIATGSLFVFLFSLFRFIDPYTLGISESDALMYLLYAYYIFVLVFTFCFDLKYWRIADEILLPAILIGLIATIGYPHTPHIIDALIGLLIGSGFFAIQSLISHGKWIGLGDIRIGAFMGVILGWKFFIIAIFVSYLIGSLVSIFIIVAKKKFFGVKVPLAPFLVIGTLITIFYGEKLLNYYIFGL